MSCTVRCALPWTAHLQLQRGSEVTRPFTQNIGITHIYLHNTYMPPLHRSHMCVMHVLLSAHLRLCFPVDGVVSVLCSGVECRSICSVYLTLLQRAVICLYSNVMYGVYLRMYSRKHVQMSYLSVSFTGYCMRGASNLHCLAHSPFRLCFHTVK